MLKLDFTLNSASDRANYINTYLDPTAHYTQKELETISNYLLYGKDESGETPISRKEIYIDTKHSTYQRKAPESLDALMESPAFNESAIVQTNIYKVEKPHINRELDADIPGIQELWDQIDAVEHIIQVNQGKLYDPSVKRLTSTQLYELKHTLVEMRTQQFFLKDAVRPTICRSKVSITPSYYSPEDCAPWDQGIDNYSVYPLGFYRKGLKRFEDPLSDDGPPYTSNKNGKYTLDFTNPTHLYLLYESWEDLEQGGLDNPESNLPLILDTLNYYAAQAQLTEPQQLILSLKIRKYSNKYIAAAVNSKYRTNYSPNYISTIYKQKICAAIAETAQLLKDKYDSREDPNKWKKCNKCGRLLLRDGREFMKRSRSSDGFAATCKKCCKEERNKDNGNKDR